MKLYCMCQITGKIPPEAFSPKRWGPCDNQVFLAPNRFLPVEKTSTEPWRAVMLQSSMDVLKNGVIQKVSTDGKTPPNPWPKTREEAEQDDKELSRNKRHYPNVDFYQCRFCGSIIIME